MKFTAYCENADSPKARYGAAQLVKAIQGAHTRQESLISIELLGHEAVGWMLVGLEEGEKAATAAGENGNKREHSLGKEGYQITVSGVDGARRVNLYAEEEQGFLYGMLELAEQWELDGPWRFSAKTERGFVPFRGAKCNLPWEPYQEGYSTDINRDVYWDLGVWERYLDRLARGRTNVLMLWSQHPYHLMVKVPGYPEACPYSDEELQEKVSFWKTLFAMAKARGMDVFMLTWNIHLHEKFAEERGFRLYGQDHPVIRDYLREAIKELIAVYDDLSGFATNPGERMYDFKPGAFEEFILDVYFKALKEAKRQVPFLLRSNWLPPEATRATIDAGDYPGTVYIDWKFNTSHGLSTWKLSGKKTNRFLNPAPSGYKMLWHIRNEEAYMLQWGDPEFIRNHMVHNYDERISAGYFFGPERVIPFLEEVRLDADGQRLRTYDFDRRWYMYEAWGRMGYNPQTPPGYWHSRLNKHYGPGLSGSGLYDALRAASQVALEFNTFWAGSWDGTAYAEGNLGFNPATDAWDGTRERRFISVTDFIFHECLDEDYMTVPDFVNHLVSGGSSSGSSFIDEENAAESLKAQLFRPIAGKVTPVDVSRRMEDSQARVRTWLQTVEEQNNHFAKDAGDHSREEGTDDTDDQSNYVANHLGLPHLEEDKKAREWSWLIDDLTVWSGLAGYYAHKIQASTLLYAYMVTGMETFKTEACTCLELAANEWQSIAVFTSSRYARQAYDHFSVFHWERYTEDAYKDIKLAQSVKPLAELAQEIRCYRLDAYESDGWGTSMDHVEAPEMAAMAYDGRPIVEVELEAYLSGTYVIKGAEYQWKPITELSPSLETLKSGRPVQMVRELSKRYDIRHDFEVSGQASGTAYFAAVLQSNETQAALYELRTADYIRMWVNGKEVFQTPKALWYTQGRRGGRLSALLFPGNNLIVIKSEAAKRPFSDRVITHREDPDHWGFHLERGFSGYEFDRHHIFPHTIRGLKH